MPSYSVIKIRDLCKSFNESVILDHISFDLHEKESFVVAGMSGVGKSVLIKCILGLIEPDSGDIFVNERNLKDLPLVEKQKIYSSFGVLFQGSALFDSLTVFQNVSFSLVHGEYKQKRSKKEIETIALAKLELVDLDRSIFNVFPHELSGGMKKRVALARAISNDPSILFFDEPTAGLDPITSSTVNDLILRCVREMNVSSITITHDMASLKTIGDRIGLLFKGNFIWSGPVKGIDTVKDPYLHQFVHGLSAGPLS
jgi:phospholipid/cholesterol/gamma-HCH transport system ATP-binding protein